MKRNDLAIVGMACHFPGGADSAENFWNLLLEGKDTIVEVPESRWDSRKYFNEDESKPGKAYVKRGGFLQEPIDEFDPLFFGISPRDAECLDPQQRFLLETTWEAIESGGIKIEELQAQQTGVFIGGFCLDNMITQLGVFNREVIDASTPTSSTMAILANRISHVFNLHGPSVSMDTACSSSLVATHLACQSLWGGDSDAVIVGGVNIMTRPEYSIAMSKGHFLSPLGQCRTFDKDAVGYCRGEGVGIVIIKPLDRCDPSKDNIFAVIKGSGVNQDGNTPGISVPSQTAQENLIRKVCQKAGVEPGQIKYVEAHGTGTQAGDKCEASALHNILQEGRKLGEKCWVGSVKTNIGHLEAGAGIAGLMKAALCLYNKTVPQNLHFDHPNPEIPFEEMCIQVPTQAIALDADRLNYASVNSFGYGGTNAHVILAEVERIAPQDSASPLEGPVIVPLSANSDAALQELANRYMQFINSQSVNWNDFLYSTTQRRSHLRNRMAIVAHSMGHLKAILKQYDQDGLSEHIVVGMKSDVVKPFTFVFTGMGPQRPEMGKVLYESNATIKAWFDECDQVFQSISGWSILEEIIKPEASSRMSDTRIAQPANFMIQVGLVELLRYYGIRPAAVIGHSVGEVAAAFVSGALNLKDALKVSFHRSQLQSTCSGGAMLAVGLSEQAMVARISTYHCVDIAAINSPDSVTLSGDPEELKQIAEALTQEDIFNCFLSVEVAYHSQQMDPIHQEVLNALAEIDPKACNIPYYSTVTTQRMSGEALDANYWWQNIRQPVRFSQAISQMFGDRLDAFIEIGPHPVLRNSIKESLMVHDAPYTLIQSLNRNTSDDLAFYQCLAQIFTLGHELKWDAFYRQPCQFVPLPNYPWQKSKFVREALQTHEDKHGSNLSVFLADSVLSPTPSWETEFSTEFFRFVQDHQVNGQVVFPGAGYVELMQHVGTEVFKDQRVQIEDVNFEQMLIENPTQVQKIRTEFDPATKQIVVYSNNHLNSTDWKSHARGKLVPGAYQDNLKLISVKQLKSACHQTVDVDRMYQQLSQAGLAYGPAFRTISELSKSEAEVFSTIHSDPLHFDSRSPQFLNPGILDGAFQSLIALLLSEQGILTPYVPVKIEKIKLFSPVVDACQCYGKLVKRTKKKVVADLMLFDLKGHLLADIEGLTCQAIASHEQDAATNVYYHWKWDRFELAPSNAAISSDKRWLIFVTGAHPVENDVLSDFINFVDDMYFVFLGDCFSFDDERTYTIDPESPADFEHLISVVRPDSILYLPSLEVEEAALATDSVLAHVMPVVYLSQAVQKLKAETHLKLLTQQAQSIEADQSIHLNASPLWSLGQLLMNESAAIQCSLYDIHEGFSEFRKLSQILLQNKANDYLLRNEDIYVRSLQSMQANSEAEERFEDVNPKSVPIKLVQENQGLVDSLVFHRSERHAPAENEVEILVKSAALNYKDVLKVYNRLPDYVLDGTYFSDALGMEVSGLVVNVGAGVTHIQVGDEVIAPVPNAFQSYITVPTTYVIPKPKPLSFDEAPVMVGYLAAVRGLIDIAHLKRGEKILIHNATGGVGVAAIQIAQLFGAEIYATAGTPEKRQYLQELGVDHIYDSRSLLFVEEILNDTNQYGVDVAINAIAGDALYKSFELLAPYGRFIEIGKREIGENAGLPMRAFNRNLLFASVDIDRMLKEKVEDCQDMLKRICDYFNRGDFKPNPVFTFPVAELSDAFKFMSQSKHMGKVVVSMDESTVPVVASQTRKASVHPDGTYLVTGGTNGFGLEVAKWLVKKGAKNVVICSRRGASSDEAKAFLAQHHDADVAIRAEALDVTDKAAVNDLVASIQADGGQLRGIFHSAMVLDDAYLTELTLERFKPVLATKIGGAINLYEATRSIALDYFVSFSSISSIIGNQGQANYVVANSFLDQFSHFLRQQGIPGCTINWGVFLETGVVNRSQDVKKILELAGISGFTTAQALDYMQEAIETDQTQVGIFDVDWAQWGSSNPEAAGHPKFASLVDAGGLTGEQSALIESLVRASSKDERARLVASRIIEHLSETLKIPVDKVDPSISISNLGIDSLAAIEFGIAIETSTGVNIKVGRLLEGPSINELSQYVNLELLAKVPELQTEPEAEAA